MPGDSDSSLVCLLRYVVPGLCAAAGVAVAPPGFVPLGAAFTVKPDLWYSLPVQLEISPADYAAGHVLPLHRW